MLLAEAGRFVFRVRLEWLLFPFLLFVLQFLRCSDVNESENFVPFCLRLQVSLHVILVKTTIVVGCLVGM